jgi:S1-C subfamily serine protease
MSRGITFIVIAAAAIVLAVRVASSSTAASPLDRGVVDVETSLGYQSSAAAGTGMVLSSNGVVLTNNHVIRGATAIRVVVPATHRSYRATVIGYDVARDVAVLKLNAASGLATIVAGDSSAARAGDRVTAVGNAGGVGGEPSAAQGTITALNRSITASDGNGSSERLTGLIQTNAHLQPGDSGGALVDSSGRVVGMNTAASTSFYFRPSAGQGFAIPINRALTIEKQIVAGHASAGVHIGPTPFLGIDVAVSDSFLGAGTGVVVGGVVPSSPAERAGLTAGDVITALDGHAISSPASLTARLLRRQPGMKVKLVWLDRLTGSQAATVTLASGPPQ